MLTSYKPPRWFALGLIALAGFAAGKRLLVLDSSIENFNKAPNGVYRIKGTVESLAVTNHPEEPDTERICLRLKSDSGILSDEVCSRRLEKDFKSRLAFNQELVLKVDRGTRSILAFQEYGELKQRTVLEGTLTGEYRAWGSTLDVEVRIKTPHPDSGSAIGWFPAKGTIQKIEPGIEVLIDQNGTAWTKNPSFF